MALNGSDPFARIRQLHKMLNPLGDLHRMFLTIDTLVPQALDLTDIIPDVSKMVPQALDLTDIIPDVSNIVTQVADSLRTPLWPDTMSMATQLADSVRTPVLPDIASWAPRAPELRNLNVLSLFNITSMLQATTTAIARLAVPWSLFSDLENWRDVLKRARRHVPRAWRQILAAQRAIEQGDLRRVEDFTVGVLGLTRDDIGYLYEAMVTDPWENSGNPVGYLRKATRWRRARDENIGSRAWLLSEAALTPEHNTPTASPLARAQTQQNLYPGVQVDLMRVVEALRPLPDALALHLVLMDGGTAGDMRVEHGWDSRRLERAKKQRQRALEKLRASWVN
jgi:hypothetical protein